MNKTVIKDVFNNELEYDPEVLRLYNLDIVNNVVNVAIAPFVVDEPSIDALAKFVHDAEMVGDKVYTEALSTLDEDRFNRLTRIRYLWTIQGTELAKQIKTKKAEPKNYTILGVELKNGGVYKNLFQTPDGRVFKSCDFSYPIDDRHVMPSIEELYTFVVEYKVAQLNNGKYRYPQFKYEKF